MNDDDVDHFLYHVLSIINQRCLYFDEISATFGIILHNEFSGGFRLIMLEATQRQLSSSSPGLVICWQLPASLLTCSRGTRASYLTSPDLAELVLGHCQTILLLSQP